MKALILFVLLTSSKAYSKECAVDMTPKGANPNDCIHCTADMKTPVGKAGNTFDGVMNFVSNKEEQQKSIAKYKATLSFLNSKKNKTECSNYNAIASKYKSEFRKDLNECEEGPDMLDRRKMLCDYVLNTYSSSIIDTFYAHWSKTGANGKPELIPGRFKEQIEGPIRAHDSWCRKVKANYKNKMFISCGEVAEWVREFDYVKKISDSMRRDREAHEVTVSTEDIRKKQFDEGCKYFETHPATTLTKDLYLECITR